MTFDAKEVVIDGRGHLLGRLASIVAKELLSGQKVVVVRSEELVISGGLARNQTKFAQFLRKRTNTNPKRGPFHFRAPSRIFWRTVRGMIPHKTFRGQQALLRLKTFEGIPPPYDEKKRVVVPQALKILRLKPGRRFTVLGRLAHEVGWGHHELVQRLEAKRKIKAEAFYQAKKAATAAKALAERKATGELKVVNSVLESFGYSVTPTPTAERTPAPVAAKKPKVAAQPAGKTPPKGGASPPRPAKKAGGDN